jgi:Transglutaminase-like superfamily
MIPTLCRSRLEQSAAELLGAISGFAALFYPLQRPVELATGDTLTVCGAHDRLSLCIWAEAGAVMTFQVISPVKKFFQLSRYDRLLLVEATLWLAIAGFAIAVLPFRQVGRLAARPTRRSEPPPQVRLRDVKRIRWSIIVATRRLPWRAMCFQQGLAAQFMLRRRGVPSVLCYGAAPNDGSGLSAHVWVRDGDVDVIGGDIAHRFAILATFPPQNTEVS